MSLAEAPLLEVDNVSVDFQLPSRRIFQAGPVVRAVSNVSFAMRRSTCVGIVGESGSGKSTLARAVIRLQQTTAGTIRFDGKDIASSKSLAERSRIQMVFQDPNSSLNPRMLVGTIVAEPMEIQGKLSRSQRKERVGELLQMVGLPSDAARRHPHEFSGGQRQRIAIARAFAVRPDLLICDEPVSALDVSVQAMVINLLMELQTQSQTSLLFISHELSVVKHIAQDVVVMYLGQVVEMADRDGLFDRPLHPYTKALISSVPVPDPKKERERPKIVLEGEIASPLRPPSGCKFHSRCPHVVNVCREKEPQLEQASHGHSVRCHRWAELSQKHH